MILTYIIAFASILAGALAQFMLKMGVGSGGELLSKPDRLVGLMMNPWFIGGVVSYGLSLILWLQVLSQLPLSKAYPMVSLGYVMSMVFAYLWLGESITAMKVAGVTLIVAGVVLISRG